MRKLYKKYRREICIGVIVSLITGAILKIKDWLIEVVPTVGVSLFETISNILYSLAATYSDTTTLRLLLLSGFSLLVGSCLSKIIDDLKTYRYITLIEKESRNISDEDKNKIYQKVLMQMENKSKDSTVDNFDNFMSSGKKFGKSAVLILVIIVFVYLIIGLFVVAPMNISNNFEQDIVKISPYVDEQQIKELESNWLYMRSKSDYDAIYKVIDEVKKIYELSN